MTKIFTAAIAALALSFAVSGLATDVALAKDKKPALKTCTMKTGKTKSTWKCQPDQTCCVSPEGKGVCGISGLGCL